MRLKTKGSDLGGGKPQAMDAPVKAGSSRTKGGKVEIKYLLAIF